MVPISSSDNAYNKDATIASITGNGAINGTGASFDFFTDKNGNIDTKFSPIVSSGGGSYQVGETITIPGSLLGGSSPENDVTFDVTGMIHLQHHLLLFFPHYHHQYQLE